MFISIIINDQNQQLITQLITIFLAIPCKAYKYIAQTYVKIPKIYNNISLFWKKNISNYLYVIYSFVLIYTLKPLLHFLKSTYIKCLKYYRNRFVKLFENQSEIIRKEITLHIPFTINYFRESYRFISNNYSSTPKFQKLLIFVRSLIHSQ